MLQTMKPTRSEEISDARIARAIRFLARNYQDQPDLAAAAAAAGLSPSHFQREFSRLVGVSPKSFVAALTLEHAKASLDQGASVLNAALDAGLSGASRLHDLVLKVEAMTPGDYSRGGAGLSMAYGFHPTIFGIALITATSRGLCGLALGDEGEETAMLADMSGRWPNASFAQDSAATTPFASRIFDAGASHTKRQQLPLQLYGTPWQIKVWQALIAIPEGKVTTYSAIAEQVCTKRASRAVGAAVGRNPISLIIPCHRVIAASGALTGYHWGVERKRAMLAVEAARAEAR